MKKLLFVIVGCGMLLVAHGAGESVKASAFGWNAEDATACLQAALDSGARVVRVDKQAGAWITSKTIYPRSNQEIVFEDGVVVQAKRGCFKGITDSLFAVRFTTNTVMRGEGKAVLRMCMPDYLDETRYKPAEWRHGVSTQYPVNFTLRDLTIEASGGDGVYVNGCRNMVVENVISSGNNRQGVSVISVDGLVLRNCVFKDTKGGLPECGIDIEPHIATCYVKNVLIEGCRFLNNNCHGIAMNLSGLGEQSGFVSIKVKDCVVENNRYHAVWAILSRNTHLPPKGEITFENIRSKNNGSCPVSLENLSSGSYKIRFQDCDFDGLSAKGGLQFTTATDFGDVTFDNCTLRLPADKEPTVFIGATGSGVVGLRGKLNVVTEQGARVLDLESWGRQFVSKPELRNFKQNAAFDIKKLHPLDAGAKLPEGEAGWSPVVRYAATLLVRVPARGSYKLYVKTAKVGPKWFAEGGTITVYDGQGTTHDIAKIKPYGEVTEYMLKSQGALMFKVKLETSQFGGVQYKSTFPGTAILCKDAVDFIGAQDKEVFFPVPAGSQDVKVEFNMSPGEPMSGRLINAQGEEVAKVEKARQRAILASSFPKTAATEIWCLKLDHFFDDGKVRIGGDALPIVSPTAADVLVPAAD